MTNATSVFTAKEIKEIDKHTIIKQSISSGQLMERAASIASDRIIIDYPHIDNILFICGVGNNGGDGLAMVHLFTQWKKNCFFYIIGDKEKATEDWKMQYEKVVRDEIKEIYDYRQISFSFIVDCLFGIGLHTALAGEWQKLIEAINQMKVTRISIDLPSGMIADQYEQSGIIVQAHHTYSFHVAKKCFLYSTNLLYIGRLTILDIQLYIPDYLLSKQFYFVSLQDAVQPYRCRPLHYHKGSSKRVMLIGGQQGMAGAIALSALATVKAGAGLTSLWVPQSIMSTVQNLVPAATAMVGGDVYLNIFPSLSQVENTVCVVGMGMGTHSHTIASYTEWLYKCCFYALVLDADALNILSITQATILPKGMHIVLTPHIKEWERLANKGEAFQSFQDSINCALQYAQKHQVFLYIKNTISILYTPTGEVFVWNGAQPALAKGGSGDMLSGTIASFLSQQYTPIESVLLAQALIHIATNQATQLNESEESCTTSDIIFLFGKAFHIIRALVNKMQ